VAPRRQAILFESAVFPNALDDDTNKKKSPRAKARKYNVRVYEHFPVRQWNSGWTAASRGLAWCEPAQPPEKPAAVATARGVGGFKASDSTGARSSLAAVAKCSTGAPGQCSYDRGRCTSGPWRSAADFSVGVVVRAWGDSRSNRNGLAVGAHFGLLAPVAT